MHFDRVVRYQSRGWRDALAFAVVLALIGLLGAGLKGFTGSFAIQHPPAITLSPAALPAYTLRTVMRMLAAMTASLLFTFSYATLAAKNRRAGAILIPLLDVLQSVPVLGYLSFTVAFFVALLPGSALGPELAAIFAIFTSQAWNMAFSFYQSLTTVPRDLDEASRSLRATAWQRFWRLEVPFAMPGLVWNMMMSMSGGWFFVVAAEAISVGRLQFALPGVGSYVALAIDARNLGAVGWAVVAMAVAILLYDQILFRPLVTWSDRFRFEQTAATTIPRSALLDVLRGSPRLTHLGDALGLGLGRLARARIAPMRRLAAPTRHALGRGAGVLGAALALGALVAAGHALSSALPTGLGCTDVAAVARAGALTFARVVVLIALASLVWVPLGVAIGLRPQLAGRVQPVAQFLAAFPANLLFPFAVVAIVHFDLSPIIWLSPLMILGTQWYILFNVIAGASAFPSDFREAARTFRVRPQTWWRRVVLPGVFPYYVTGAITAAGGAWNASIVSETVRWGGTRIDGGGLGAYIAAATEAGDYPRIALGIALMAVLVVGMNVALWQPLYRYAAEHARLD